ncbi:hypothetical protein INT45_010314 [Circinella minor]|uniref:Cation-transporting P-type ATPase C-terminal domain-containing protein n=1 Tax=Circinella minor TaxID=1195481 RepID=A0A8H7VNI2_9FUNG|nr:hypothetical protein INT45_010314 [Circinella minor]
MVYITLLTKASNDSANRQYNESYNVCCGIKPDVGFSMDNAGTEVVKEAFDIIHMDNNFNSILKALLWGRVVNDGVRKYLIIQLNVNIAVVALSFISAVDSSNSESVLSAVQPLRNNLIMGTLVALALATESPTNNLFQRKPISKYTLLINFTMVTVLIGSLSLPVDAIIRLLPDCEFEHYFREDTHQLVTYSRMHWEGAINDVGNGLHVYSLLGTSPSHGAVRSDSSLSPPADGSNPGSNTNIFASLVTYAVDHQQNKASSNHQS